jgi:hypothetical protein
MRRRSRRYQFKSDPRNRDSYKDLKDVYIIAMSRDGREHQLTSKVNWDRQPQLQLDTMGEPMVVIKEFRADSYARARQVYEQAL